MSERSQALAALARADSDAPERLDHRWPAVLRGLARDPGRYGYRLVADKLLRGRVPLQVKATLFNGEVMHTLTTELDLYLCGYKRHPAELALTRWLLQECLGEEVFFDVGAHHGFYAVLARALAPAGSVHAFEPSPRHFRPLSRNAAERPGLAANNLALSSRPGRLRFYESLRENSLLDPSLLAGDPETRDERFKVVEVDADTLDAYCARTGAAPTLLKLDVEGAERDVLAGARHTLAGFAPRVVLEVWRSPLDYRPHLEAMQMLSDAGYRPFRIEPDGRAVSVTDFVPDRDIPLEDRSANVLFQKP